MNTKTMHQQTKNIILKIEEMGLKVTAVITNKNTLNCEMMSLFAKRRILSTVYEYLVNASRPFYYVIDLVNILKCIRNNWLNYKTTTTATRNVVLFSRN